MTKTPAPVFATRVKAKDLTYAVYMAEIIIKESKEPILLR